MPNLLAVRKGLEPSTSGVTGRHSNQLNYRTRFPFAGRFPVKADANIDIIREIATMLVKKFERDFKISSA